MTMTHHASGDDVGAIVWHSAPRAPCDKPSDATAPDAGAFDFGAPEPTIFAAVARIAARRPDHPALVGETNTVTFAQLVDRATALALCFSAEPPGPAGVLVRPGPALVIAILGCMAAGRTALLLSHGAPPSRNRALLSDGAAACVIIAASDESQDAAIPPDVRRLNPDALPTTIGVTALPPSPPPDAPAIVVFTSGSTGTPKGIVRSHGRLLDHATEERASGRSRAGGRLLCLADPTTGTALSSMVAGMALGMTQLLAPVRELGAAHLVRRAGEMGGVTHLVGTAALMCLLLRRRNTDAAFGGLERLIVKGDALLGADLAILRGLAPPACAIEFNYGLTETSRIASWWIPPDHAPATARVASGYLREGLRYAVRDEAGQSTPAGACGELWISSRELMSGEWRAGEVVRQRLVADPNDPTRDVFCTGDLVRLDANGLVHVLGRRDRQVKINGVSVDPAESENVLRGSPFVAEAAVLVEDHPTGPALVAHVVRHADAEPRPAVRGGDVEARAAFVADLRARLRRALPTALHPSRIIVADRLPRIGGGKADARALAAAAP